MPSDATPKGQALGRILIVLVVAVLLINVPISRRGKGLVQHLPQATSVVFYEGMVLQGSGDQVYVLQEQRLRPFSDDETFKHFRRLASLEVVTVDDRLLTTFGQGPPIYHLMRCPDRPEVYAASAGQKRLFSGQLIESPAYWDRVTMVSCTFLEELPTGPALAAGR